MSDVNKTTHTGTAITNPTITPLSNRTPMSIFTLKVRESWTDGRGKKKFRDNLIKIETLGRNSNWVKENVVAGKRYHIDGYVRYDVINGKEEVKIRSFNISEDDNDTYLEGKNEGYKDALVLMLGHLDSGVEIPVVKAQIEQLLKEY